MDEILDGKYAVGIHKDNSWDSIFPAYVISSDYLTDQETWDNIDKGSIYIGNFDVNCIAEGLINSSTGIYSYNGDLLATYPENWDITSLTAFCDGYAEIYLEGADGNTYVTVVNTDGIAQFDPVKETEADELVRNYIKEADPVIQTEEKAYQRPDGTTINSVLVISNLDEVTAQSSAALLSGLE